MQGKRLSFVIVLVVGNTKGIRIIGDTLDVSSIGHYDI